MKKKKKDSRSILYNQEINTTNTAIGAVSCHCYSEEDLLSTPSLSKCNHKYFSGIAQSSKLVCDSCNEIIGEWRFHLSYDVKKTFPQPQYLIYKIHPHLRRLTAEEVKVLV
jgi:hypothetical protein